MLTDDFKAMSLKKRQCRLGHEIFDNATHQIYAKVNCIFDCHINLAFETCKCVPWDFVNNLQGTKECDVFGRTCFFNMIETLTHGSDQKCSQCIDECDSIKYRRRIIKQTKLGWVEEERFHEKWRFWFSVHCNKYVCIDPSMK